MKESKAVDKGGNTRLGFRDSGHKASDRLVTMCSAQSRPRDPLFESLTANEEAFLLLW